MEENIVNEIRIERLSRVHGFRAVAVWINRLMVRLGKYLYDHDYLSEIAETDALTGLFNRNFFERWGEVISSQAKRSGASLAIVMVDIDNLKVTNDSDGHLAGDKMIKVVAKEFLSKARKSDVVIRLGGDEFLLLLWKCSYENAVVLMDKHLTCIEKKGYVFSYGVAMREDKKRIADVLDLADERMYEMKVRNKKKKRGRV
jgi:diguanylate cyclase (GGDEF)-like protein